MRSESRFSGIFRELKDHRVNRTRRHSLENIIFISMAAVICGAETWNEIEEFGKDRIDWFSKYLDLPNGVPSHDTFNRFFSGLDTSKFEECFRRWVSEIVGDLNGDVIAIDGKTIRGSRGHSQSAIHMVSAWSKNTGITLGQIRTSEKSNEITAIPELLDSLFVKGAVVTIDAMGTREDIVDKIVAKEADYVLQVKRNNPKFYEDVQYCFDNLEDLPSFTSKERNGGRDESRTCIILSDQNILKCLRTGWKWKNLKSIIMVQSESYNVLDKTTEQSTRYYISSLDQEPERICSIIRGHWSIENNLHWQLDVSFGEDASQKRNENAIINFSLLNKIALSALKAEVTSKVGIKSRRKKAGWSTEYLEKVLGL